MTTTTTQPTTTTANPYDFPGVDILVYAQDGYWGTCGANDGSPWGPLASGWMHYKSTVTESYVIALVRDRNPGKVVLAI